MTNIKIDMPNQDVYLFNSEDEVLEFFSYLDFKEEDIGYLGIDEDSFYFTEDDEEIYKDVKLESHYLFDIHDSNVHSPFCESTYRIVKDFHKNNRKPLKLNKSVWSSFPCIAYMWFSSTSDRLSVNHFKICHVIPVQDINTVSKTLSVVEQYKDAIIARTNKYAEFEMSQQCNTSEIRMFAKYQL